MLKVLPIQSKDLQEEICTRCGVSYNADLLAYAAYDDDTLLGVCQFRLCAEGGMIYDLSPVEGTEHFEGLFIMGRGTLNFMDLCGADKPQHSLECTLIILFFPLGVNTLLCCSLTFLQQEKKLRKQKGTSCAFLPFVLS